MSIDISPITAQFSVASVLVPVLQVISVLAAIVAVTGSVAFVYAMIRGDAKVMDDFRRVQTFRDDVAFRGRYRRERRDRDYQAWKIRRDRGYQSWKKRQRY